MTTITWNWIRISVISGHKSEAIWAKIGQTKIWESKNQKLLGVIIDCQLNFDEYLISLSKKARKKLSTLARLAIFLSLEQWKLLMKSFIESQFGYCPLTWMFCGRKTNTRINHVHERAVKRVYRNSLDKNYNMFQTTCFNQSIFFMLTNQYKFSDIYTSHNNCPGHMLIT